MQKRLFAVAALALTCASILSGQSVSDRWPRVLDTSTRRVISRTPGNDTPLMMNVLSLAGVVVYRLECHNGDFEGPGLITYSGDFHCAVFAISNGDAVSWNLLADDTDEQRKSDWMNRGRMIAAQMKPPCARSPYGTTRQFRFRGLKMTFEYSGFKWETIDATKLEQFSFSVTVAQDPTARTERAERVSVSSEVDAACR